MSTNARTDPPTEDEFADAQARLDEGLGTSGSLAADRELADRYDRLVLQPAREAYERKALALLSWWRVDELVGPDGDAGPTSASHLTRAVLERHVLLVLDAYRPRWVPARLWPRSRVAAAVVDHLHALGALPTAGGRHGRSDGMRGALVTPAEYDGGHLVEEPPE